MNEKKCAVCGCPIGPVTIGALTQFHLQRALARNAGNKTKAAADLGVSLKTVYNWLDRDPQQSTCDSAGHS